MEQGALLGRIEHKLRELRLPIAITLWDGRRLEGGGTADVNVTIRSPKVLASLAMPTLGKLARHYVEHELDLDGEPRQIIRQHLHRIRRHRRLRSPMPSNVVPQHPIPRRQRRHPPTSAR